MSNMNHHKKIFSIFLWPFLILQLTICWSVKNTDNHLSVVTGPCRYLDGYNVLVMKRKCHSSSNTTSSNSDEDKQKKSQAMQVSEGMCCCSPSDRKDQISYLPKTKQEALLRISHSFLWTLYLSQPCLKCQRLICSCCSLFSLAEPTLLKDQSGLSALDDPHKKTSEAATAVVGTSMPLPVPNKPESVVSITSQCSYSSTIVHVGDKKPQPESGTVERKTSSQILSITQHAYTETLLVTKNIYMLLIE